MIGTLLPPVTMALAGAYVGAVRGFLAALAQQMIEMEIVRHLYAVIRPSLNRAATALRERSGPVTRSEMMLSIRNATASHIEDALSEESKPRSFLERVERSLVVRSQRVLCAAALVPGTSVQDREVAVAELESTSIAQIELGIAGAIGGFYATQAWIVLGGAALVCALPYVIDFFISA